MDNPISVDDSRLNAIYDNFRDRLREKLAMRLRVKFHGILLYAAVLPLICPVEAVAPQESRKVQPPFDSRSDSEMLKLIRGDAERGDASEQVNLGFMYFLGSGVAQDYGEAERWFRKAAEQHIDAAWFNLGMMYLEGKGVPQDHAEAASLLRKAAEQDDRSAQCMLGVLYVEGWGVARDYVQAYKWLSLSVVGDTDEQTTFLQKAKDLRDKIAGRMTPRQMEEAQALISELEHVRKPVPKKVASDLLKSRLIIKVEPDYLDAAREAHIQGVVILIVTVDEHGDVENVQILRGHPLLVYAAIEAVQQWKYSPVIMGGKPVKVTATVTVYFVLDS